MVNQRLAVVMFCGPHYDGCLDFGRFTEALWLAQHYQCHLLLCGDGNSGRDLAVFSERARKTIPECLVHVCYDARACTRSDAQAAAQALTTESFGMQVEELYLVTDWYHMPRAHAELAKALDGTSFLLHRTPVWQRLREGLSRLPHEFRGWLDCVADKPHHSRGAPYGKPVAERESERSF